MQTQTSKPTGLWLIWIVISIAFVSILAFYMFSSADKTVFMPGPMTGGHHQIGVACESCHTDALAGNEVLQQACVDCHGDDRQKPFDSHPRSKFTDPRNAEQLEHINALECITCHTEHQPEMTAKNGLTQPADFCVHCHSDIGEDRPSHKGMEFDTCNDAGCHNFHNNRALYTDFLVKHQGEPEVLEKAVLPEREFASVLGELIDYPADRYPVEPLTAAQSDVPADVSVDESIHDDWLETAHARSGVNCSACHEVVADNSDEPEWVQQPTHQVCAQCHGLEVDRFQRGKHGMRLAAGLAPMKPGEARLPMHPEASHTELGCTGCQQAHRFDVQTAAVDACLECHSDQHSLAYKQSPHFSLWEQEQGGEGEPGSGVSCASCHMPRVDFDVNDWMSRIMVEHNQNATLSPNEKMIRPACLNCHGLAFSLDALADEVLIENNFKGRPAVHVESMELAEADRKRAEQERAGAGE